MQKLTIKTSESVSRTIYAYITPDNRRTDGYVKIGQTIRDADVRIAEQTKTAQLEVKKLWEREARFNGGGYFTDKDFHRYLRLNGHKSLDDSEWYYFGENPEKAEELLMLFTFKNYKDIQKDSTSDYVLRDEQNDAVTKALSYSKKNPKGEFLWNAKPRFGKTLSAYDLVRQMEAHNVLIVTNRPAIANSWFDDFEKFIGWQTDYKFVSDSGSLKDRNPMLRKEWERYAIQNMDTARQISFVSLQDLKGSAYHGGDLDKLKWVSESNWDLLIIDEAHEGIDTFKTDVAFNHIKRDFTLHLSGTPFKAIAGGKFDEDAVYNWSYQDEQEKKHTWNDPEQENPYEKLPQLNMYTYQMSHMIAETINQGATVDGENYDYAFDLNEFFSTDQSGKLVYEKDVKKWLDTLTSNEKYPFSTPELRNELKHTFWMLHRVASAKALARLLNDHPVFENYEVIIAAGDGKSDESDMKVNEDSLSKVKKEIQENDKTITLSVGQLTTGVTIPEWSAVLMLSNMASPALYMQAAFRAQNPCDWEDGGKLYQKQNAYVFDFAPERTLVIFDEFANNLNVQTSSGGGSMNEREKNIKTLLNFFPVIGEDSNGEMKELDFNDVLTLPQKIKSAEVVKRGFMSNLLFANITGIFHAPAIVMDALGKLNPESQGRIKETDEPIDTKSVDVDDKGEVVIDNEAIINKSEGILGDKVYQIEVPPVDDGLSPERNAKEIAKEIMNSTPLVEILDNTHKEVGSTKKFINQQKKVLQEKLEREVETVLINSEIELNNLNKDLENNLNNAKSETDKQKYYDKFISEVEDLENSRNKQIEDMKDTVIPEWNEQTLTNVEKTQKEEVKNSVEDDVRSRLRGFARTIPSFIMAYGDEDLRLGNFDEYVDGDVFEDVTGITLEDFMFLRDGGYFTNEEGIEEKFDGGLFNEVVFDESIREFLRLKSELSNYFEDVDENIYDYIPPQNTNQIYTPKWVVQKMVDALEQENAGIYDDSSKTFIDLYMKSGLYITEVVKRLYNSEVIKSEYPDDYERLKHILENQVYGLSPTKIIHSIATSFIFGDPTEGISQKNFVYLDAQEYAEDGTLSEKLDEVFGD